MILRQLKSLIFTAFLLCGCDESVTLNYSTRAEAEAGSLFARGWLPEIIPASSRNISMRNDLDLNISNGEFIFDAADHDYFVTKLKRESLRDEGVAAAYIYREWIFWINPDKNYCRFEMRLNRSENSGNQ